MAFIMGFSVDSQSILWFFFAIECTWELPTALGKPSRRYLKLFFNTFSKFFSKFLKSLKKDKCLYLIKVSTFILVPSDFTRYVI